MQRPEVNIGIVCANAPIIRPLYLYFQGRLQTQKTSGSAISKERMVPSNVNWSDSTKLQDPVGWNGLEDNQLSGDTTVSLEMGLPSQSVNKEQVTDV